MICFRYDGASLVRCDHYWPEQRVKLGRDIMDLRAGSIVLAAHPISMFGVDVVCLYLTELDEFAVASHAEAILAALGRCNACAMPFDEHGDEDRAACAEVLREIDADERAAKDEYVCPPDPSPCPECGTAGGLRCQETCPIVLAVRECERVPVRTRETP